MLDAERLVDRLDAGGDFAGVAAGPVGSAEDDNHGRLLRSVVGCVYYFAITTSDVAAEVTRRISSLSAFRLLTSAATVTPSRLSK